MTGGEGREKRAKQIGITYPGKLVNARAKRWILTSMGTLYIQAFYPAVGLDRKKKKKKTGWWSIEAPSANRRKEETIAAGVDVKFMTGCKHGNSLSLSCPIFLSLLPNPAK